MYISVKEFELQVNESELRMIAMCIKFYLEDCAAKSIQEFDMFLENNSADLGMLNKIFIRLGQPYLYDEAEKEYQELLEIKPKKTN